MAISADLQWVIGSLTADHREIDRTAAISAGTRWVRGGGDGARGCREVTGGGVGWVLGEVSRGERGGRAKGILYRSGQRELV